MRTMMLETWYRSEEASRSGGSELFQWEMTKLEEYTLGERSRPGFKVWVGVVSKGFISASRAGRVPHHFP